MQFQIGNFENLKIWHMGHRFATSLKTYTELMSLMLDFEITISLEIDSKKTNIELGGWQ